MNESHVWFCHIGIWELLISSMFCWSDDKFQDPRWHDGICQVSILVFLCLLREIWCGWNLSRKHSRGTSWHGNVFRITDPLWEKSTSKLLGSLRKDPVIRSFDIDFDILSNRHLHGMFIELQCSCYCRAIGLECYMSLQDRSLLGINIWQKSNVMSLSRCVWYHRGPV